jgi:hypothetical protein
LEGFEGELEDIEEHTFYYPECKTLWALQGQEEVSGSFEDQVRVLTELMSVRAYHSNPSCIGFQPAAPDLPMLESMRAHGLVVARDAGDGLRWFLSVKGQLSLQSVKNLQGKARVFEVRDNVALHERTAFELASLLVQDEWEWQPWVPVKQRSRRTRPIPAGYEQDKPKEWFSSLKPSTFYMMALLQAQDVTLMG